MTSSEHHPVHIVAVVPFTAESGGDELLVLRDGDGFSLPGGPVQPGERLLDAAARVVLEQAGFLPDPQRLVYLLERQYGGLIAGVQCGFPEHIDDGNDLRGEFISLAQSDAVVEPMALREILVEDLRSGFVRPVAHLIESTGGDGPLVQITW